MKRLLLTLQNLTDDSNAIHYFDQRGFEFLSDFIPKERDRILGTFLKFLFVRDPLDRILSSYRNKFLAKNIPFQVRYGRDIVRRYRKPRVPTYDVKGDDVTFQEFVRYLIDKKNDFQSMNEHWMPMYELCQPCYVNYDFVGSFEDLDLDTSALLERIHAPKTVKFPRKQSSYGKPLDSEQIYRFYANVTADEYNSIRERFKNDLKCFGYKFHYRLSISRN